MRHGHDVEQTRWLDARSRHSGELLSSNSVRRSIGISDTDLEGLDHHEASGSGSGAEKANQPDGNENPNGKNNTETKYPVPM